MTIGRNMPCPCGSRKKYKKCCLNRQQTETVPSVSLNEIMAGFAQNLVQEKNNETEERRPPNPNSRNDFKEIPTDKINQLAGSAVNPAPFVQFSDITQNSVSAPIIELFTLLHAAIGEKGLNFSDQGDLPQPFLDNAARSFWNEQQYLKHTATNTIARETDFFDMHRLRLIAAHAGVIRKYRGKFIVGTKYRKPISSQGAAAIYGELFTAYVTKFDWTLLDEQKHFDHIKQSFLFSLYLLSTYGDVSRPHQFYEDCYLKTFPTAVSDMVEKTDTETVRKLYFQRTFVECFTYFGLAKTEPKVDDNTISHLMVEKLPLLDTFVKFSD